MIPVYWFCLVRPSIFLSLRDSMPVEDKIPVKTTNRKVARLLIGKSVFINDVNDGTNNVGGVPGNSVQERLQPAWGTLAMAVQICQNLRHVIDQT